MAADKIISGIGKNVSALSKVIFSRKKNDEAIKPAKASIPDESTYSTGLYFRFTSSEISGLQPIIDYFEVQRQDSGLMQALKNISMANSERYFYEGCKNLIFGFRKKAIEFFYKSLEKSPQMSDAYFMIGVLEKGAEKKLTSKECFQKALILNVNLGKTIKKVLPTFRLVLPITNHLAFAFYADFIGVNILQALTARISGKDEGLKFLRQALDLMPGHSTVIFFYALFLYEKGKREKAAAILKTVMPGSSAFELNYLLLGKILYDAGDYTVAAEVLKKGQSSEFLDPQLKVDYEGLLSDCDIMQKGRFAPLRQLDLFKRLGIVPSSSSKKSDDNVSKKTLKQDLSVSDESKERRLFDKKSEKFYPICGKVIIGSSSDADVLLEDELVSDIHAVITSETGRLYIEDFSSDTGTFINNYKITAKMPINRGDTISLGNTDFIIK